MNTMNHRDNRELYKSAFSNLHADHTLDLEAMKMKDAEKKNMTGLRCKRGILVTTLVLIMMLAMTAITYAATDGEVFQAIKVFISNDGVDDGQVREGTYTVDEDGNYTLDVKEGDNIHMEGPEGSEDDWTIDYEVGSMNGRIKAHVDGKDDETIISQLFIDEITSSGDEPVSGWVPLEEGEELSEEEIQKRMEN